jgi:hypothetical protein
MGEHGAGMSRRAVLRGGGVLGLALLVPFGRSTPAGAAVAVAVDDGPRFLTDHELDTLRALVDRFVPGEPEDTAPGAVAAGCAEAIDALLGAFLVDPPRIYAGGPFSDRGGSAVNHFAEFLPLDGYETTAWRLRIEGSRGRPELEFNGPVKGYQATYREGLAALDDASPGEGFAALPAAARDLVLRTTDDEAVLELIDLAFPHTLEFLYGAPEYGGNRDLVGWRLTDYDGDVQPRGWTREEVEQPDQPGVAGMLRDLPLTADELAPLLPLTTTEQAHGMLTRSGGRLRGLRAEAAAVEEAQREARAARSSLGAALAELAELARPQEGRLRGR